MRGEHYAGVTVESFGTGSSPRARGTLCPLNPEVEQNRIIPACAGNTHRPADGTAHLADHPRVRGEHAAATARALLTDGSSPRARGTRPLRLHCHFDFRIIPACAGNTGSARTTRNGRTDHPRVRGEHPRSGWPWACPFGSSPRARGTHLLAAPRMGLVWIIPACAGNTSRSAPAHQASADHPRVRGEHSSFESSGCCPCGSSPRARGTPRSGPASSSPTRIIPACAGNTSPMPHKALHAADHPRVRGEHVDHQHEPARVVGSSPRARGTRRVAYVLVALVRIIPACAGNTACKRNHGRTATDHPRVRGEHPYTPGPCSISGGSSPRARGTPRPGRVPPRRVRIIPACAGNTPDPEALAGGRSDHPRVRGEHWWLFCMGATPPGSSPRARGTLVPAPCRGLGRRIIPACAGNTR